MTTRLSFSTEYEQAMAAFSASGGPSAGVATTEPEAPPAEVAPRELFMEVSETIPESWKSFSEVFSMNPPSGNDRRGPVYTAGEFPDNLRPFIPVKATGYCMDPANTEALWNAHIDSDTVWLWGQSGTGKSSLEEQFAAHIGQPFLRFNGREDIEASALFGQLTVESGENGGTVWKDGLLTEGVKYGARVLMDEATVIPAGIFMGMQWLTEKGGKLMLTDKPATAGERLIDPDPRFRLTYADNTRGQGDDTGQFNSTGIMNTATLNRVGLTLEIKFLDFDQEVEVITTKFGDRIHADIIADTVRLAQMLREGMAKDQISLSFSLRSIESMLNKAHNYRTMSAQDALFRAFKESYANLLPNDDEFGYAENWFGMVFSDY